MGKTVIRGRVAAQGQVLARSRYKNGNLLTVYIKILTDDPAPRSRGWLRYWNGKITKETLYRTYNPGRDSGGN